VGRITKALKIRLDSFGSFLGMEKGCIILRDKKGGTTRYPLFEEEIGEVILQSGNMVSTGVLSALGFWQVDVLVTTRNGNPIAMLKNLEDDSHVKTRISQYESLKDGRGFYIAKQFLIGKIEGQNMLLNKYGLQTYPSTASGVMRGFGEDDFKGLRKRLTNVEGHATEKYFGQIFGLFPESIRPRKRRGWRAYDGLNNTFNFAYSILFWKCYRALVKAHLEPYLGYLHSLRWGRPSLVCDFQELYRHLVDGFLIEYCKNLELRDFKAKTEMFNNKKGRRIYLKKSREFEESLHGYFMKTVRVPRIKRGNNQEIETLINEEALLLAKYLRKERDAWKPRIAVP